MPEYAGYQIPEDEQGQRDLLRAFFNVRLPAPSSAEFLKIQDAYLQERAKEKGITDIHDLKPVPGDTWPSAVSPQVCSCSRRIKQRKWQQL